MKNRLVAEFYSVRRFRRRTDCTGRTGINKVLTEDANDFIRADLQFAFWCLLGFQLVDTVSVCSTVSPSIITLARTE